MQKSEKELEQDAYYDAHSLIRAEEIRLDKVKYNRALRQVSKIKAEKHKEFEAVKSVARKKSVNGRKTMRKITRKNKLN